MAGVFKDIGLIGAKIAGQAEFNGSTVMGLIDADGLEVGGSMLLRGGEFKDINLLSARIAGQAGFNGSTVTGLLYSDGLEVGGSMLLDGGVFKDVYLIGARIADQASFSGSAVTGNLHADELEVGNGLFLRDGSTFAEVRLLGAHVGGNAELDGATVAGLFAADGAEVEGSLFLRDGSTFAEVRLPGARVGRDVDLDGATFTGLLLANGLEVVGNVFMRDAAFKEIDLLGTKIGGDLLLSGGQFGGNMDLSGASIGGELHLSSSWMKRPPDWLNEASLVLRNASAHALQARRDSWELSGGHGLLPTDLTGFTYNRLGGLDRAGGSGMGDESADWLIRWIEAQRDYGVDFDPQPYTQLARALESAGATDKAKAIRYAKFEHKLDHDTSLIAIHRVWLWLKKLTVGYGVYPFWVLGWFSVIVLVGAVLAQWSKDPSVRRVMGLWYSLENALPLIGTSGRFKNVEHGRPGFDHIFLVQKFLGFVLATVLVGVLTLLGG